MQDKLSAQDKHRLERFLDNLKESAQSMMGYPAATDFDYSALHPFLEFCINNVGDPFLPGTYKIETHQFEREVIEFWAELTNAPQDNWWGYVGNGGSEGNLYGLYLARELHPKGIVYFSQDTHYSVTKNLHFLNMPNIMVRSQENGEIDYQDLLQTLKINCDVTPIIFANIGTTMTEAKDDIGKIRKILNELEIDKYYIHSDAAMSGSMAPFLDPKPSYDFSDGADSISISGHKFIGAPIPCGIILARRDYVNQIGRSIAYIGSMDTTISGSRNGFTPLILWYAMRTLGKDGMQKRVERSLELADYAEQQLNQAGIAAWRNPNAITVVMPEVDKRVQEKWQLATANGISHIMLMPSAKINEAKIDELVYDLTANH